MVDRGYDATLDSDIEYGVDWVGYDEDSIRRPGVTISFDQDVREYMEQTIEEEEFLETEEDLYGDEEVDLMNISDDFIFFCFPDDDQDTAAQFTRTFLETVDEYAEP